MKRLTAFGWLLLGLSACGGEDEGGDAMAEEVGGACVFTPGQYVISYEVRDTIGCDGAIEPLNDEFVTVLSNGNVAATGGTADPSCVDSPLIQDGCFSAYSRHCEISTDESFVIVDGDFEYHFSEGSGNVAMTIRGYLPSGANVVSCVANMEATIRER